MRNIIERLDLGATPVKQMSLRCLQSDQHIALITIRAAIFFLETRLYINLLF